MKKQERRHFTPEQKSKILREHHLDKVPVLPARAVWAFALGGCSLAGF